MYTFKILYSYKGLNGRTRRNVKLFTVQANTQLQAKQRVRELFAKDFDGAELLGMNYVMYETYVTRDYEDGISEARAAEMLGCWLEQAQHEAEVQAAFIEANGSGYGTDGIAEVG